MQLCVVFEVFVLYTSVTYLVIVISVVKRADVQLFCCIGRSAKEPFTLQLAIITSMSCSISVLLEQT